MPLGPFCFTNKCLVIQCIHNKFKDNLTYVLLLVIPYVNRSYLANKHGSVHLLIL